MYNVLSAAGVVHRAAVLDVQDRRGSGRADLVLVGAGQQAPADHG